MPTAVFSNLSNNPFVNGILFGTHWSSPLTYSFADSVGDLGSPYRYVFQGFEEMSAAQQFATRYIIGDNDPSVASGIRFTYGSFTDVADIPIQLAANPNGFSDLVMYNAFAQDDLADNPDQGMRTIPTAQVQDFPDPTNQSTAQGDIVYGTQSRAYDLPKAGNFAWHTHIHEISHALGLKHGHDAGSANNPMPMPRVRNGGDFSVMTYNHFPNEPLGGVASPSNTVTPRR